MHHRSVFGDRPYWPLLKRLAVVAATVLAGLLACGALLVALGGPVPNALAAGPVNYPGSDPCNTTLQACIDGTVTGATIVVQAGIYTESFTLSKAVNLTGVSSATVILHALANQRVLTVTGAAVDSSVIISGLTFAGGHVTGFTCPDECGGAILIKATAQPLLINLTISNSLADFFGGGLYADASSPLVMSGVVVLSNTAGSGGGGAFAGGNLTLNGGLFQNNQCTGVSCAGGGLFAASDLSVTGTRFFSNTSDGYGGGTNVNGNATLHGGLYWNNQCTGSNCTGGGLHADNNLNLTGTQFFSNTSDSVGGGAYAGNAVLNGGLFWNNQCIRSSCRGSGLFSNNNLTATDSQFLSNTSGGDGGGAFANVDVLLDGGFFQNNQCTSPACKGGGLFAGGDVALTGTQFLSNTSAGHGGGGGAGGNVTLSGGLFENNQCTEASCVGGGLATQNNLAVTNSQFRSNTSGAYGGGAFANVYARLNGGSFQNNQCTGSSCRGGGLFVGATLAVTNTQFLGNRAQYGAGLYHDSGDARLVNDLFAANTALSGQGDALFLASPGAVTLLHTTIASPTLGSGAAVYVTSGTVAMTNTLIASYTMGIENAGGSVQEDYTLFSGVTTHLSGTVVSGGNSLAGTANFVDPAAGNYHLRLGSAAIDSGVNAGISFDIDGDPRPLGNGFDIGYDEANIRHLFLPLVWR